MYGGARLSLVVRQRKIVDLPVIETFADALHGIQRHRARIFRALVLPSVVIAGLGCVIFLVLFDSTPGTSVFVIVPLSLMQCVFWALLAVSCHRVLLEDLDEPSFLDGIWIGLRQLRYMFFAVVVAIPITAGSFVFGAFVLPRTSLDTPDYVVLLYGWLLLIPLQYLSSRFSLTLPAAALRRRMSLAQSWAQSKGNGWRITTVLLVAPVVASLSFPALELVFGAGSLAYALLRTVAYLVAGIAAIAGLSFRGFNAEHSSRSCVEFLSYPVAVTLRDFSHGLSFG